MNATTAFELYKKTRTNTAVEDASPHKLISMMMDGALEKVAIAMGAMERKQPAVTGESISKAISIVDNLRVAIDHDVGGKIAANLHDLYDYITRRLLEANIMTDVSMLEEVAALLTEIKIAWAQVPTDLHEITR